jgi:hypothetical protein
MCRKKSAYNQTCPHAQAVLQNVYTFVRAVGLELLVSDSIRAVWVAITVGAAVEPDEGVDNGAIDELQIQEHTDTRDLLNINKWITEGERKKQTCVPSSIGAVIALMAPAVSAGPTDGMVW